MIENKYIYWGHNLYKLVEANKAGIENSVSLINIMTRAFARHRDSIICDSLYENDELFLYDSTFKTNIISNNRIKFYCSNPGLESYYIANCFDSTLRIVKTGYLSKIRKKRCFFKLIGDSDIFVSNYQDISNFNNRKLIVFGSSSTEIFDYIFGNNPDYLPFWASGWSARGLHRANEHMCPYLDILNKISKDSIILFHFGSVDVDFNLPYKIINDGFYDINSFIKEMVNGVVCLKNFLNNLGFNNIYATFTAPPIDLPSEYWNGFPNLGHIPPLLRGKVLWDFSVILSLSMPVINCLPDLVESVHYPICDKRFVRKELDHHVNFIAVQDIVYNRIKSIDGMLPRREKKHNNLYHHLACDVFFVKKNNQPRLRTCH